ncbi:MAG: helix-turn-helix domain-containing protein, partial [Nocardioidaceae bacterium]
MRVSVSRRSGVVTAVAVAATAVAAGYLWWFTQTGHMLALPIALGLGVIAAFHFAAGEWSPLMVADETGLLIRLGGEWAGVPWESLDRIEVIERGRVREGRLTVVANPATMAALPFGPRSRLALGLNRLLYDAALVVPFGLTTRVAGGDLVPALTRLSDGRAPIVIPTQDEPPPPPTVQPVTAPPSADLAVDEHSPIASPHPEPAPVAPKPKRRLLAAVESAPVAPLARAVSALTSRPAARREEVVIRSRGSHQIEGTLALSEPIEPEPGGQPQTLPEIRELRRHEDMTSTALGDQSNVGLIIDATTDLSARAMEKVRRSPSAPAPAAASAEIAAAAAQVTGSSAPTGLLIGAELGSARGRLRLTTDELSDRTRIRAYVIESIEVDDFRPCGGDFYARGHLRMLARVLGLDPEPLVATYDEHFATSPVQARDVFEVELAAGTTGMVRGGALSANWGALIATVLVLMLLWGVASYVAKPSSAVDDVDVTPNAAGLGSPGVGNDPVRTPPPTPRPTAHVKLTAGGGRSHVAVNDASGQ